MKSKITLALFIILMCPGAFASSIKSRYMDGDISKEEVEYLVEELRKEIKNLSTRQEKIEKIVLDLKNRIDGSQADKNSPNIDTPQITHQDTHEKEQVKTNPSSGGTEKQEYDIALSALKSNDYAAAAKKFERFIEQFPKSPLVANAYFWLGESQFKQNHFDKAALQYLRSYKNSPKGPKSADSLLKLATSLSEMKKTTEACGIISKLEEEFPNRSDASTKKSNGLKAKLKCK
ncbi:MAG: tol-pal system protein YbgF [Rickettsiaceae bacterium]|nr:tol-pal system protein YbgF [Rickettsiaceae bacterium]